MEKGLYKFEYIGINPADEENIIDNINSGSGNFGLFSLSIFYC